MHSRFSAPPSPPTLSPHPLSPVGGLVTELVRTQGDLRRAQDALVAAESTETLRLENLDLERRLAEADAVAAQEKLASAQEKLASVKAMITTARSELKIERSRPRTPGDKPDTNSNGPRPRGG